MILPLADDPTTTGTVAYDQQHVVQLGTIDIIHFVFADFLTRKVFVQ